MDLSTFYAIVSGMCFTLVGLWWTVVERHPAWKTDAVRRRLAGGTYLSFLLPGVMALFAQIAPETPAVWRITFVLAGLLGLVTTGRLIASQGHTVGPLSRQRWVLAVAYLLVVVLGAAPEIVRGWGWAPPQVGGVLLSLLVLIAHALAWEFLMAPEEKSAESTA